MLWELVLREVASSSVSAGFLHVLCLKCMVFAAIGSSCNFWEAIPGNSKNLYFFGNLWNPQQQLERGFPIPSSGILLIFQNLHFFIFIIILIDTILYERLFFNSNLLQTLAIPHSLLPFPSPAYRFPSCLLLLSYVSLWNLIFIHERKRDFCLLRLACLCNMMLSNCAHFPSAQHNSTLCDWVTKF